MGRVPLPEVHLNRTQLRAMAASPTELLGGDVTVKSSRILALKFRLFRPAGAAVLARIEPRVIAALL